MAGIELRHLEALVAVADEGSVTRAAARLHTAQPAVSRTVQQLEHRLGVALFVRSAGGVVLTPAGQAVLADAGRWCSATPGARPDACRPSSSRRGGASTRTVR
jgi:DNA-binding transcriptional LysR family regulator